MHLFSVAHRPIVFVINWIDTWMILILFCTALYYSVGLNKEPNGYNFFIGSWFVIGLAVFIPLLITYHMFNLSDDHHP